MRETIKSPGFHIWFAKKFPIQKITHTTHPCKFSHESFQVNPATYSPTNGISTSGVRYHKLITRSRVEGGNNKRAWTISWAPGADPPYPFARRPADYASKSKESWSGRNHAEDKVYLCTGGHVVARGLIKFEAWRESWGTKRESLWDENGDNESKRSVASADIRNGGLPRTQQLE